MSIADPAFTYALSRAGEPMTGLWFQGTVPAPLCEGPQMTRSEPWADTFAWVAPPDLRGPQQHLHAWDDLFASVIATNPLVAQVEGHWWIPELHQHVALVYRIPTMDGEDTTWTWGPDPDVGRPGDPRTHLWVNPPHHVTPSWHTRHTAPRQFWYRVDPVFRLNRIHF